MKENALHGSRSEDPVVPANVPPAQIPWHSAPLILKRFPPHPLFAGSLPSFHRCHYYLPSFYKRYRSHPELFPLPSSSSRLIKESASSCATHLCCCPDQANSIDHGPSTASLLAFLWTLLPFTGFTHCAQRAVFKIYRSSRKIFKRPRLWTLLTSYHTKQGSWGNDWFQEQGRSAQDGPRTSPQGGKRETFKDCYHLPKRTLAKYVEPVWPSHFSRPNFQFQGSRG